jgi:hypothetical protein
MEKIFNPIKGIKQVPFETPLVKFVDHIIDERIRLGRPTKITNDNHWSLILFIVNGWYALYPEYASEFIEHMKRVRRTANALGVAREGEAILQHQIEVPQSLFSMIKVAFPEQKWDKKFVLKFARKLPAFKGSDIL